MLGLRSEGCSFTEPLTLTGAVDGITGSGKTMALCHAVHYCFNQGWLVLHIPDGEALPSLPYPARLLTVAPELPPMPNLLSWNPSL